MVKYKEYFYKMCSENQALFAEFKFIHNLYSQDKRGNQVVFNEQGLQVRKVIEDWDHRLCSHMEKGKNSTYSANLSEKFWGEVRSLFPLIDFVGVKINRKS